MSEQDKLRKTLREYYDSQQFEVPDNEWDRASVYISSTRRGRKIRYTVYSLIGLFSISLIAFYLLPETSGPTLRPSVLTKFEQKIPSERNSSTTNSTSAGQSTFRTTHKKNSVVQFKSSALIIAKKKTPKSHALEQESTSLSLNQTFGVEGNAETIIQLQDVTKEIREKSSENGSEKNTEPVYQPELNLQITLPEKVTAVENKIKNENSLVEEIQKSETIAEIVPQQKEETIIQASAETIIQDSVAKSSGNATVADTAEVVIIADQDTLPVPVSGSQMSQEGIYYEAGGTWLNGWKGAEIRDAQGFSPVLGINYMNRLDDRFGLSFGAHYMRVGRLSTSSKTSRESVYKYGEQSRVTVITPRTAHYIVAPFRLHYFLDQRNSFGGAVNLAYLLNVDATVMTYDEKPGSSDNYQTIKLSGYTEGFSWYDSQIAIFYNRRIWRSLRVQAEIFLGLTDVKQNDFFGLNETERNSGAKLTLVYYAFRKNGR